MSASPNLAAVAREVDLLKEQVTSLFSLVGQQTKPRDPSIKAFCERHGISRGTYLNLRNAGKGPRETAAGTWRRTISEEAELDWTAAREAEAVAVAEQRKIAPRKRSTSTKSQKIGI